VWIDEDDSQTYDEDEKYDMTETDGGDTDYTDGKRYSVARVLAYVGDGVYNYRFYASDETADATGTPTSNSTVTVTDVVNNAPTLAWTTADCLSSGVRPGTGDDGTDFEFMVDYTDADNQCAVTIQVWIDENDNSTYEDPSERYDLTEDDAGDTDCTDGKLYKATRALSLAGDNTLNYRVYATDGVDDATGDPVTGSAVAVVDAATVRPSGTSLPKDYTSIDTAVDDTANNGKYIMVYPNDDFTAYTYGEKVTTNSSSADNITLMSACGADLTIIDNTVDNSTAFFVQDVSYMVIDGFSITGASSGSGVDINRVDNTDFTIRNSKIYGNATGINLSSGQSRPIYIENNEIYSNTTRGIYLPNSLASDIRIISSEIHSNNVGANAGAAMYMNTGSAATISKSIIRDNTTTGGGGAIYTNAGNLTIENSIFANNQGSNGGVISSNSGPTITIVNSTFADNTATNQGGVIYICALGNHTVRNSIFWGNTAGSSGHIAYKACSGIYTGFMTITDSDVDTDPEGVYNYFGNGTPITSNNIDPAEDPLFVNATEDNYMLLMPLRMILMVIAVHSV
jgi:predicted outer membrane repeat protein